MYIRDAYLLHQPPHTTAHPLSPSTNHPIQQLILNQTAFLLMVSVLLDTFLIRAVVVPILMTLTGASTWWPRKDLPAPTKDVGVRW